MKLHYVDLVRLSLQQNEKVTANDIKIIRKKSGKKSFKICFSILSIILIIFIPYYWITENEVPLFFVLFFLFLCLPMTIESYKHKELYACYGIVKEKTVRCARISGRGRIFMPYENTVELGTYKHKYTLSQTVCEYYFCTVEINENIYENICCDRKDFSKINEGEKIVIYLNDIYNFPVIYSCSNNS